MASISSSVQSVRSGSSLVNCKDMKKTTKKGRVLMKVGNKWYALKPGTVAQKIVRL